MMQIHAVFGSVHDADGDVGAVVCRPFQIREQIQPDKACLDGAEALFQAAHMGISHSFF